MALGRGLVCWGCGYAGLGRNADEVAEHGTTPAGVCAHCGSDEQTNFLQVTSGKTVLPWMELKADLAGGDMAGAERALDAAQNVATQSNSVANNAEQ
jgi:hypothetical protein